jgi:hypothetical protein
MAFIGVACASVAAVAPVAAQSPGGQVPADALREAAALQSGYYDELDLPVYRSLEKQFGASNRVIASTNAVRFGNLEVRAKLVLPLSVAPRSNKLMASSAPEPVRVMLDYALVSCGSGCSVSILTDRGGTPALYKAQHEATTKRRGSPGGGGTVIRTRDRTASMVVIEGKQARKAIQQLNDSRTAHVFLTTAVHGGAHFEFDTTSGAKN